MDKLLYAVAVGIDALRNGNIITYTKIGKILFGEARNPTLSPRVKEIQRALTSVGIGCDVPEDMVRTLWWKFMVNVGMNQASAVTGAPYGEFQTSPEAQSLMESLMREVIILASYAGVNLVDEDIADWYEFLNKLSPQGKTSMLQDIEARRKTEVDIFGGKVVELGREYKIPTPVNQTVLRIIRVMESRYRPC
jgi:2-dehydropantoate 2-reductase